MRQGHKENLPTMYTHSFFNLKRIIPMFQSRITTKIWASKLCVSVKWFFIYIRQVLKKRGKRRGARHQGNRFFYRKITHRACWNQTKTLLTSLVVIIRKLKDLQRGPVLFLSAGGGGKVKLLQGWPWGSVYPRKCIGGDSTAFKPRKDIFRMLMVSSSLVGNMYEWFTTKVPLKWRLGGTWPSSPDYKHNIWYEVMSTRVHTHKESKGDTFADEEDAEEDDGGD